jgi:cytidyltransferase-like protein
MKSFLELVEEEKHGEKHHVMAFGRMNPPTTGHLKVIDKVKEIAKKHNATHSVVTSHSQDSKKNPLSAEQKIKHLKRYSPGTHFEASSKEHPTFLHHAAQQHARGVTHLHMVVGSDRVKEMREKLHKYNGTHKGALHNFKKITVHSAGQRDPDAEGTTGMSGTKMREHAKNKDIKSFKQGVPSHVSDTHAKELMHDTRKGMGLHESAGRGMFKAIFVTGGPGSGKDIVIREAIAESRAVEINTVQAFDYLNDKQKLSEKTNDFRREAIRNRGPLIINGPAEDHTRFITIKEELEELGYITTMVFVNTTNESSKERNERLTKSISESVRQEKWNMAQTTKEAYIQNFDKFMNFDNTGSYENIEEDITTTYKNINVFIDEKIYNDTAFSWLENHGKLNINETFKHYFKETLNATQDSKSIQTLTTKGRYNTFLNAVSPGELDQDARPSGKPDDIKGGDAKKSGGYAFKTYTEQGPTLTINQAPKVSNFSKDKETQKLKKSRFQNSPSGSVKAPGIGPEFDTRQQGTVYAMSGMGDVTYKEHKEFGNFRKTIKEFADDGDSGISGVLGGADKKEPMETLNDTTRESGTSLYKKLKQGAKNVHKK